MTIEGYMVEVDWDGATLRAHGTNKMGRVALNGADHEQDVVLTAADIASVEFKGANALTNGNLVVTTRAGAKHQLHFRKKSGDEFAALAAELRQAVEAAAPADDLEPVSLGSDTPPPPPPPPAVPPGWYPNGDVQRYWDGAAWTEYTAPLG